MFFQVGQQIKLVLVLSFGVPRVVGLPSEAGQAIALEPIGERLLWFFERGFAYGIDDRFQNLAEFTTELRGLADPDSSPTLDLLSEFGKFDKAVRSTDRTVQLGLLRDRLNGNSLKLVDRLQREMSPLKQHGGSLTSSTRQVDMWAAQDWPPKEVGELLNAGRVLVLVVKRQHHVTLAAAAMVAYVVSIDTHLYATSYTAPVSELSRNEKPLEWTKIAVVGEDSVKWDDRTMTVIVEALKSKLAREFRNLSTGRGVS